MFFNIEKLRNILYSKRNFKQKELEYNISFEEIEKEVYNVEIHPEYNDSYFGTFILYESSFFNGIIKNSRTEEENYIYGKYDQDIKLTMIRGSHEGLWLYNMIGEYTIYNIEKSKELDLKIKEQIEEKRKYWQAHPIYGLVLDTILECNNKINVKTKK